MKKVRNPLLRRLPRELMGDWRKYLVVFLFLVLTIGFVSGMYVANDSMLQAARTGKADYKLESGHFELTQRASEELLQAIRTGEKADVKQYYLDEGKKELDEKFQSEFDREFDERFREEFTRQFSTRFDQSFAESFDARFEAEVLQQLLSGGADQQTAQAMLPAAVAQAKESGAYQAAYDQAYPAAYQEAYASGYAQTYAEAYDEAYAKAYEEAVQKMRDEIDKKYAEADERYKLDDPDFQARPAVVYENFFRNENEDYNRDGTADGTIRVYARQEDVNLACVLSGRLPETAEELAMDRMHADNVGVQVGDTVRVGNTEFKVVGLIAYVNYATLHEKATDMMFDALQFDVGMVTQEGFERLESTVHYGYAWRYETAPVGEVEEKSASDDFMRALLTQTVVYDNTLEDYVPAYANPAITFATEDMGSDKAMGGVLLYVLIIIIAFIFGVTTSNTIVRESTAIGTLRASGYTQQELVRHYLAMPLLVTLLAACVGNVLGYTVFKNVVVGMYYNSYSLPTYHTIWNADAFLKTTVVPLALMLVVNLLVIGRMMRHTPLQFLRRDLKRSRRKKAVRLPDWGFMHRFRLRIIFQNAANYAILFVGVAFIMVLLAMAVGLPDTLAYYQEHAEGLMIADYQYVLKDYEDEDGNLITTQTPGAERFCMTALLRRGDVLDEEVSVYGVESGSQYVTIEDIGTLAEGEAYISRPFADKYSLSVGDQVTLEEKYENKQYTLTVAGIYDGCQSIAVFMPIDRYRTEFEQKEASFSGYFSNAELPDLDADQVATVITIRDITKMCDQLDHSMGSYMTYFQYLCILLSAVMIYLLTKLIIEKNETAISMTKILGYTNREIASLYLTSTTLVLVITAAVTTFLGAWFMAKVWRIMLMEYSGYYAFCMKPMGYVKMFLFVLVGYLLVMVLDFRRIKRVPMDQALKNVE